MKKIAIILMCLLFMSGTSEAHQGIFIDRPINTIEDSYKIKEIEEAKALYSQLREDDEIDIYRFDGKSSQRLYAQLMVPDLEGSRDLLLNLVIFGPFEEGNYLDQYTPIFGDRYRGYVIEPGNNRTRFFEPFTQTNYFKKQQFSIEIPKDGTYYLAVYSPFGQHGQYVLTVGHEESFSMKELLQYPVTWFRVNYWFNPLRPFSILVLVGLVLFAMVKLLLRRSKKKRF